MRVHVRTLGCRLNQAESERIARGFVLAGHEIVASQDEAELIVLNSCTVTSRAGRESRRAARRRPEQRLVVTGCHSEVAPAEFADADLIVPSAEKENLVALATGGLGLEGDAVGADYRADGALRLYPLILDATRAFVKIQDGCHLSCAFCLTTIARGESRSRPLESILREVQRLAAQGCQEVVLTGVHAGAYGRERERQVDLGGLIDRLLRESDIPRLRLSSLEPWTFREPWLELWPRWGDRLCRHLHMSLQSGSDAVLRRMRRAYTIDEFEEKVALARAAILDLAVTTDLIVGFPGESEEEHSEGLARVEALAFSGAHLFPFSPRPGTRAESMGRQLPRDVKRRRLAELRSVTEQSAASYRQRMVGREAIVLWEGAADDAPRRGLTDTFLRARSDDPRAMPNRLSRIRLGPIVEAEFTVTWVDGTPG